MSVAAVVTRKRPRGWAAVRRGTDSDSERERLFIFGAIFEAQQSLRNTCTKEIVPLRFRGRIFDWASLEFGNL